MSTTLPKIQDYAIIGNARSAALISNRGSLDWLCWPRFDSASIFGAIVDPTSGGRWSICPESDSQTSRRYIDDTNVLETTFSIDSAKVVLTDFMPVTSEEEKKRRLWPEHEVIRRVTCENGEMLVVVHFDPRPDYGRAIPSIKEAGKLGWRIDMGTSLLSLRSDIALAPNTDVGLSAKLTLKTGDTIAFSLTFSDEGPAVLPPLGDFVREKLNLTINWWQRWAAQSNYRGPYQSQVTRSALVLKLLSYAPSGAIIAAPITSLPERIGGDLNWDYRFAWLRDAAFTVHALYGLGYKDDAEAFVAWLLHATRLTRPELRIIYDVFGECPRTSANCSICPVMPTRVQSAWATPRSSSCSWMFTAKSSRRWHISSVKTKSPTEICRQCCDNSANMFASIGRSPITEFGKNVARAVTTPIRC